MRILGIDPGIGRTGWGVLALEGKNPIVKGYGCIETKPNSPIPERLVILYKELQTILDTYAPDEMGIEELFFNTNVKTAMAVGQARGVVILSAAQRMLPIVSYTPLQVKMALTGFGRAEKGQVGQMVKTIFKLEKIPKPDDTADALAVALTHAFSRKMHYNNRI